MRKVVASAALLAALTVVLAACGDSNKQASGTVATPAPTTAAAQGAGATVAVATGDLGAVLVDAEGRTLYAFTKDKGSQSVCSGQCASTWPALTVSGTTPTPGTGVQASLLSTSKQANGSTQVTYGGKPLYYFAGDAKPGDTKGQGLNSVWFTVRADGSLVKSKGYR